MIEIPLNSVSLKYEGARSFHRKDGSILYRGYWDLQEYIFLWLDENEVSVVQHTMIRRGLDTWVITGVGLEFNEPSHGMLFKLTWL